MQLIKFVEDVHHVLVVNNLSFRLGVFISVKDKDGVKRAFLVSEVGEAFRSYLERFFDKYPKGSFKICLFVPEIGREDERYKEIPVFSGDNGHNAALEFFQKEIQQIKKDLLGFNP